jgi:hypothetical protein
MGRDDRLFPLAGVEAACARARAIYARLDAEDRCRFVLCGGGHRFYADEAWAAFDEVTGGRQRAPCHGLG